MNRDIRRDIRLVRFDRNDLSRYADRIGAGKGAVEKDFVISTFLILLAFESQFTPFAEKMVFRGGTCIKKAYYPNETRFSEDLDFASLTLSEMGSFLEVLRSLVGQDLGVTNVIQVGKTYEDTRGLDIRLDYVSILGQPNHIMLNLSTNTSMKDWKRMHVDVMPYFSSLKPIIHVMDITEILAEKAWGLIQRVRPRDVYDGFL